MAASKQGHTYVNTLPQCSPASVGLALVSQARPNQPQRGSLSVCDPRWGWLGLACETRLALIQTHLSSRYLTSSHTIRGRFSFSSYVGSNTEYLSSLPDSEAIVSEHYLEFSAVGSLVPKPEWNSGIKLLHVAISNFEL